ncbi:MAG: ABC transporter substrate-binding protein [Acidobacteriota bacterium]|nr:ABC transporter substrate-binding protein [Acidobacteriota bacterium]MDE3082387.1 ABC transporter substrate-binding protein [Acidobacteriota bacterium]
MKKYLSLAGAFLAFVVSFVPVLNSPSGAATRSGFPVTVLTAHGAVTIPAKPHAIVSLSATATEMLYAIGAGSQVRAVDKYSNYPKGAPMTSLDGYSVSAEAIAKYHPDLIVLAYEPPALASQLAKLKIPVIYDPAAPSLAVAYHQYLGLGQATGHVLQARREVAHLRATVSAIVKSTPRAPVGTTYYYELDPTYYSVTSSTFMGSLLSLLGLKSIADAAGVNSNGGYPQLTAEFIIQANPTYIFLADHKCCQVTPQSVAARPGWQSLSAVTNNRIVTLSDDIASRWGPRITILLQEVANVLKNQQG